MIAKKLRARDWSPGHRAQAQHCGALLALGLSLLGVACSEAEKKSEGTAPLSREELLDPETCRKCHARHYEEWVGSMHAYASNDPVFLAMNARGQAETDGKLGDFCVNCHAPMAVREGKTQDGLNLSELPAKFQGITCYFCHNVESVDGTHNNPLRLANDTIMRGGIRDPIENGAHASAYSELLSGSSSESASMCGACHDIVLPAPPAPNAVPLERTFQEWKGSIFGDAAKTEDAQVPCNACHMKVSQSPAAEGAGLAVVERRVHGHHFPGVDIALNDFPQTGDAALDQQVREQQRQMVQTELDTVLRVDICVQRLPGDQSALFVTLDNVSAGHRFPSGAAQDRRVWVEVQAFDSGEAEPFYASGRVPETEAVSLHDDPDLWVLGDRIFDSEDQPAHMFWEAARFEAETIPAPITNDPQDPDFYLTHVTRRFPRLRTATLQGTPERVTVRVRIRPMGLDVLDDLITSGHLQPEIRQAVPTFDMVPNRHLASHSELSSLSKVTFEWSEATRNAGQFQVWTDSREAVPKECISMSRGPI